MIRSISMRKRVNQMSSQKQPNVEFNKEHKQDVEPNIRLNKERKQDVKMIGTKPDTNEITYEEEKVALWMFK